MPDRTAFGAFLRARRDALTPSQAGMTPFPGPRRVPGLRKEEVALLAGLSPDHYSRLEQGRQGTVTEEVLVALERALRLDDRERQHLRDLAAPTARRRGGPEAEQRADPGLLRLLTALEHLPVLLLGRRGAVLARTPLLPVVLGADLAPGSSFLRWLLLDPAARERLVDWEVFASSAVASLRFEQGRHPGDRRLAAEVDHLRAHDADTARWWDDQRVTFRTSMRKRVAHPLAGTLAFGVESVQAPHDPDQVLVVYTVEPGSPTAEALPLLAGYAEGPATAAPVR